MKAFEVGSATLALALVLAVPGFAAAQHERERDGAERGHAAGRAEGRRGGAAAPEASRPQGRAQQERAQPPAPARVGGGVREGAYSQTTPQAVPRVAPPAVHGRAEVLPPRVIRPPVASSRIIGPGGGVHPRPYIRPFYQPYYSFRPRLQLGHGVWIGYPVVYPYPYYYPYPVPYPGPDPYPGASYPYPPPPDPGYDSAPGSVTVTPGQANTGGLSFDIWPEDAQIYVDGQFVGTVSDFSPRVPPLWLASGRHYVDLRSTGFEPLVFDVDLTPAQILPFQGTMQRER